MSATYKQIVGACRITLLQQQSTTFTFVNKLRSSPPHSLSLKKNKEKEKSYFYEGYEMQGFGVRDKIKTSKSMLFTNILCKFAVDYEYLHKIQDNKGA
jgi:hypothetical protein